MRFFYTLLVSGLLIFHEVPIDQHPPATSDDVPYGVASSLSSELDIPSYRFPTQYKPNFSAQTKIEKQPSRNGTRYTGQESADLDVASPEPVATKATVTPIPKIITTDTALATYGQASSLPITGYAMFYNPNVMQEVLNNRMAMGHISACPECIGNVALLRAGDLNRRVWLEWADGTVEGPFLVADTAARHHVAQLLARRWVVDVDNRTAVRRGMAGPVWVTVWGSPPNHQADAPPFMPLYPVLPTPLPTPLSTPFATPLPVLLAPQSPTPLPALDALPSTDVVATPVSSPKEPVTPTITPLPVIATLSPSLALASSTPVGLVETPLPSAVGSVGFPTDTPVPTVTPLPVIIASATPVATMMPAATVMPVATATFMPTATSTLAPMLTATVPPTQVPAFTPTFSPTPSPMAETGAGVSTEVIQRGFPTDTPVPTITPLPFITATPTPPPN